MSQPDLQQSGTMSAGSMVKQKPRNSVYTTLLGISALALLVGCLFLIWEIVTYSGSYGFSSIFSAIGGPDK